MTRKGGGGGKKTPVNIAIPNWTGWNGSLSLARGFGVGESDHKFSNCSPNREEERSDLTH